MTAQPNHWRQSLLWFVLLLAVLLPLRVLRAADVGNLWGDEVFSLLMARLPAAMILDRTTFDAHPPAYYLLLRGWLSLTEGLGAPTSLLLARVPSILSWIALVAIAWFGGQALIGRHAGMSAGATLALSEQGAFLAKELRNYGPATTALFAAIVLLLLLWKHRENPRAQRIGWTLYALAAIAALYLHLLSAIVLFLHGLLWIAMLRKAPRGFLIGGFVAQTLVVIAYLPWLLRLRSQVEYVQSVNLSWMSPATPTNLFYTFAIWLPQGRFVDPALTAQLPLLLALGVPTLIPLVGLLVGRLGSATPPEQTHPSPQHPSANHGLALACLSIAAGFVAITWLLTVLGIVKVFDGPRYPVLILGTWALALAASGTALLRALRLAPAWIWLMPLLWAANAAYGGIKANAWSADNRAQVANLLATNAPADLLVLPETLVPFYAGYLTHHRIISLDQALARTTTAPLRVLHLDVWGPYHDARTLRFLMAAHGRLIEDDFTLTANAKLGFKLWQLSGFRPQAAREIGAPAPNAVAVALPENQLRTRGFGPITHRPTDFALARWTAAPRAELRFDRAVAPGTYRIRLSGFRDAEAGASSTELRLLTPAGSELLSARLTAGAFDLQTTINLSATEAAAPAILIDHPLWTSATPDALHEGVRAVGIRFVRCELYR